jgi:hypothetical protein
MRLSRRAAQSTGMDVVAVLIAILAFAVLLALVEGLDRV